jgi:hypothetical protein
MPHYRPAPEYPPLFAALDCLLIPDYPPEPDRPLVAVGARLPGRAALSLGPGSPAGT